MKIRSDIITETGNATLPSNEITLTKEELQTFYDDVSGNQTGWSDASYRIAEFIGLNPSEDL